MKNFFGVAKDHHRVVIFKESVFNAGKPWAQATFDHHDSDTVALVNRIACDSCDVTVLEMDDPNVANRARNLGIRSVPAVVIDGKLADCCNGRGADATAFRSAGLGQPLAG